MSNYKTILWASHFMNLKYNPKPLGPSFGSVLSPKNSANSKMLGGYSPPRPGSPAGLSYSIRSGGEVLTSVISGWSSIPG